MERFLVVNFIDLFVYNIVYKLTSFSIYYSACPSQKLKVRWASFQVTKSTEIPPVVGMTSGCLTGVS